MQKETENIQAIKKRIDEINDLVWNQRGAQGVTQELSNIIEDNFTEAKSINYSYGIGRCTLSIGMGAFILKHDFGLSIKLISEALEIFKELGNDKWIANSHLTLAIVKNSSGDPESALYFALKGIEYYEKNTEPLKDISMAYYVIGTVYKDLKQFDTAESHYKKGIINDECNDMWSARIYTGLSNIYTLREQYTLALELGIKSLSVLKKMDNKVGESRALNDIGTIYRKLKKYDLALDYYFQGLALRKEGNFLHIVLGSLIEISDTYLEMGDMEKALEHLKLAEPIAKETKHHARLSTILQRIANMHKMTGRLSDSIVYYEKFIELATELNSKEKETKINSLQNTLLQEREQEIERLKNVELKNAYDLISEKNKEIMDSIHYAKRIQNALLASDKILKDNLNEHFVLFLPKDIVSGDFYWATKKGDKFYLAVCDSTGHGVPGAFMSLLNITFLNEAISEKNIEEPHLILNHVRERIIQTISQDGAQDGMDGILVCIDQSNNKITYAASNNAPVLIEIETVKDLNCDKMPIGKGESNNSFSLQELKAAPNSMIYLITDGYADQFGGPRGKKLKCKQLFELLSTNHKSTLKEQKQILKNSFENWKGELEQVDDVCIIGIRL